MTVLAMLLFSE